MGEVYSALTLAGHLGRRGGLEDVLRERMVSLPLTIVTTSSLLQCLATVLTEGCIFDVLSYL